MKLRNLFILLLIGFFLIGISGGIIYLVGSGQDSFNNQIEDYLVSSIDVNQEQIMDFVSELEKDVLFLSTFEKSKDILKAETGESNEAAMMDVKGKVGIVVKEIDNYLRAHPDKTIEELQKSKEFQEIAIQKIGKTGYTALHGVETRLNYFHVNPLVVGTHLNSLTDEFPELVALIDEVVEKGNSEGYYNWKDVNGKIRKKYGEFRVASTRTADGIKFVVAGTSYIDEYITVKNLPENLDIYFKDFREIRGSQNIFLVSPDGKVIYTTNPLEGLGASLRDIRNDLDEICPSFKNLNKEEIIFCGPFLGPIGNVNLRVAVLSQVYEGEDYLGFVAIVKEIDKINKIFKNDLSPKKTNEDYLINEKGLLITPLKSGKFDLMIQEVRSENTEDCIEDFESAKKNNMTPSEYDLFEKGQGIEEAFLPFLNYKGDLTYGLHRLIDNFNLCLMSEVNAEEILKEPLEKSFRKQITFRVEFFLLAAILTILIGFFIDKRYFLKKKSEKKFKENFFTKLKLKYFLLFAFLFVIAYFFIVTSFFQGWQNAKFFDDIPDLLIFIVGFMFFAFGLKIKNMKARYFIIYGGLLICLRRLFDIPFQEWQEILGFVLPLQYWVPFFIAEFTGFLFLLIGYRRLKNGI